MKYHFVAQEIADVFYSEIEEGQQDTDSERSRGSSEYWNHICTIEDIIERFIQSSDLTLEDNR